MFIIKEGELAAENILVSEKIDFVRVKNFLAVRDEAKEIVKIASGKSVKAIVLDSYDLTVDYIEELRGIKASITLIDDRNYMSYPDVDNIINGNAFSPDLEYETRQKTGVYLGTEYYMVSEDFITVCSNSREDNRDIQTVICLSSADKKLLFKAIDGVMKATTGNVVIILTAYQKDMFDALNEFMQEKDRTRTRICCDLAIKDVAEIMRRSVLFVSGGGTMMYQAMLSGCAVVAVPLNEYQSRNVASLVRLNAVRRVGKEDVFSGDYAKAVTGILEKGTEKDILLEHSVKVIDGRGIERISDIILNGVSGERE
ncbi:MAG: hypothetical protein GF392_04615 [Candidatus Omnitrophica bacterium]|nr:hypothetical protein [Candidatus Omnitrophota bacterium]